MLSTCSLCSDWLKFGIPVGIREYSIVIGCNTLALL